MNEPDDRTDCWECFGDGDVKQVLREMLEHSCDPSRLLEAYYWSTEPGLAEFVRQFLALPEAARLALAAFLSMTRESGGAVAVTVGRNGDLTLSSPAVWDAMKMRMLSAVASESSESMH
jgi:hypothetical protein